jgi:hypothetical protein
VAAAPPSALVTVNVTHGSPKDLIIRVLAAQPTSFNTAINAPTAIIWNHESPVDQNGQPLTTFTARGLVPFPPYDFGPSSNPRYGYLIQIYYDTWGTYNRQPPGTWNSGAVTIYPSTPGRVGPPIVNLYSGPNQQPLPAEIDFGGQLQITAKAVGNPASYKIDRLRIEIREAPSATPISGIGEHFYASNEIAEPDASTNGVTLSYVSPQLPPGDYTITATAVDRAGYSTAKSAALRVKRLFGLTQLANRVVQNHPDYTRTVSGQLTVANNTGSSRSGARIRLLQRPTPVFNMAAGPPLLPGPFPITSVYEVGELAPGAKKSVAVSGTTALPDYQCSPVEQGMPIQQCSLPDNTFAGVARAAVFFDVYAVLEEAVAGEWTVVDSLKLGSDSHPYRVDFGGPGGGENDPNLGLGGTTFDPFILQTLQVAGPSPITQPTRYTAKANYRNSNGTLSKDLVADTRLRWSVSDQAAASINSDGDLTPFANSMARSVTVQAAFTLGGVTRDASLPITIAAVPAPPVITSPGTASGVQGQPFAYQITASGNATSFGATGLPVGLFINAVTGLISGTPADPGTTTATIFAGNADGTASQALSITIFATPPPPAKLINISTRGLVSTNDAVMIGGFAIRGAQPKTVLIRAVGPSLAAQQVPNVLLDPTMSLHAAGETLASNDNWNLSADQQAIAASGFAPSDPKEPAIIRTLNPGDYTAIVRGAGGLTGIGLVEVYDLEQGSGSKLINISTRGFVSTGDAVMIGGFAIRGGQPKRVLIRAVGPSLAAQQVPNVLPDPTMSLHSRDQTLATNDDWNLSADRQAILASGFAPSNPEEPAIVRTLDPGDYTAIVRGTSGLTGIGLVEVYELE